MRPVTELSKQMERTEYGKQQPIHIVHTGDEIEILYQCFQDMMTELYKGEQERIAYEKQKRDMEYDITLSQINPHYLYNVLNTVVYLSAAGKNQDVVKIVHSLIYTLHETLKVGDGNVETTIEKELELTKCYLDIQRYRYPDVFQVEVKCEEGLKDCLVPKTMIQPLVENAILHGILPTEASGKIWIIIQKQGEKLCVMVKDEGIGVSKEQLKRFKQGESMAENKTRKHIGVENVCDRIHYLYNRVLFSVVVDVLVHHNGYGIALFDVIVECRLFDEEQAVVDGVAEEDPREGFRDHALDSQRFDDLRCLFSGRTAAEVFSGNDDVAGLDLGSQLRAERGKSILFHIVNGL